MCYLLSLTSFKTNVDIPNKKTSLVSLYFIISVMKSEFSLSILFTFQVVNAKDFFLCFFITSHGMTGFLYATQQIGISKRKQCHIPLNYLYPFDRCQYTSKILRCCFAHFWLSNKQNVIIFSKEWSTPSPVVSRRASLSYFTLCLWLH